MRWTGWVVSWMSFKLDELDELSEETAPEAHEVYLMRFEHEFHLLAHGTRCPLPRCGGGKENGASPMNCVAGFQLSAGRTFRGNRRFAHEFRLTAH